MDKKPVKVEVLQSAVYRWEPGDGTRYVFTYVELDEVAGKALLTLTVGDRSYGMWMAADWPETDIGRAVGYIQEKMRTRNEYDARKVQEFLAWLSQELNP